MITILRGSEHKLDSYGHGTAYVLTGPEAPHGIAVQGDEALDFRLELEAIEHTWPEKTADEVLHELAVRYL